VTEPFCQGCGRVRLTADGKLRLCLLRDDEVDLLTPLRAGAVIEELRALMRDGAFHKPWGHGLAHGRFAENRAMNQIGGWMKEAKISNLVIVQRLSLARLQHVDD
jgi:cyclic pyranopterin phosphate synthase